MTDPLAGKRIWKSCKMKVLESESYVILFFSVEHIELTDCILVDIIHCIPSKKLRFTHLNHKQCSSHDTLESLLE